MVYGLKVPKNEAEKVRKKLVKSGLLDDEWYIEVRDDYIIFPLKKKIDGAEEFDLKPRTKKISPYRKVIRMVGKDLASFVPKKWEKIGDVILLPNFNSPNDEKIAEAFAKVLKAKTVVRYKGVQGEFRTPIIEVLYGNDTETVHIENGIKYMLDVSKLMFSSGNIDERIRMGTIDMKNETVVDMFAGIGYFSLPIAIYAGAKKVYACEKNPVAFYYLLKNISLNRVKNIIPLFGDNRKTVPLGVADRVVLGYIDTRPFLELGFKVLKPQGGWLHYHDTFTTEEIRNNAPSSIVKECAFRLGFLVEDISTRIIKSYAPHIWHAVVDVKVIRKSSQKIK